MTIRSHLRPETLISCVAGALPNSVSGVVACHLSVCPECARHVRELEFAAGLMLEGVGGEDDRAFAERALLKPLSPKVEADPEKSRSPPPSWLPSPLAHYLGMTGDEIPWKPLMKGVEQYWIKLPEGSGPMRLLKVPPKFELLEHSHRGMELTMILKGVYSDHTGDYFPGDVTEMTKGTSHQPRIVGEEECICLVAGEKMPRYRWFLARWLAPILGL